MTQGLAGVDFVYAPHAIYDRTPGVERSVYGAGDPVPMADAIRYGLVAAPEAPPADPPPAGKRRSRRKVEDRAHHLEADR
jgi:hypothetical protein